MRSKDAAEGRSAIAAIVPTGMPGNPFVSESAAVPDARTGATETSHTPVKARSSPLLPAPCHQQRATKWLASCPRPKARTEIVRFIPISQFGYRRAAAGISRNVDSFHVLSRAYFYGFASRR
jgi:hypothetical protein